MSPKRRYLTKREVRLHAERLEWAAAASAAVASVAETVSVDVDGPLDEDGGTKEDKD